MAVVAAVDKSERARKTVAEAAEVAAAFDDTVHVIHVLNRSEFVELEQTEMGESGRPIQMERVRELAAEQARNCVPEGDIDVPIEFVGKVGDAGDEILDYASNHDTRYIAVGPRQKSPTGKALFGSVSQFIILDSTCPVIVTVQ